MLKTVCALFAGSLMFVSQNAAAAEITFLGATALQPSMQELIPEFEKTSGHKVKASYMNIGTVAEHVRKGEAADLAIMSPQQWESLQKEGKVAAETPVVVAKVGMGVAVKKGGSKPDVSSVEAFKTALLNAPAISIGDPADGSPTGTHAVRVFDRLAIMADVKPKLRLVRSPTSLVEPVATGEVAIGLTQISIIVADPRVDLAGPLPADIQNWTVYVAGPSANAKEPAAAKAFAEFLKSPRAAAVFKSKGLQQD